MLLFFHSVWLTIFYLQKFNTKCTSIILGWDLFIGKVLVEFGHLGEILLGCMMATDACIREEEDYKSNYIMCLFLYYIEASLCTWIHSSFHSFKTEANVWRTVVMAQFHACGIVYTLLLALYQLLVWWCGSHHLFICMHVYYNIVMCSVSPYYNLHQWWYHTNHYSFCTTIVTKVYSSPFLYHHLSPLNSVWTVCEQCV